MWKQNGNLPWQGAVVIPSEELYVSLKTIVVPYCGLVFAELQL